ncbi:hypothetical protein BVRB_1g008970 [Beta vulgaris subsp. vulgaris]|nr:hypothetical protein BVRB_1g008970 [Beta vulgaris subsp. vulgaris]
MTWYTFPLRLDVHNCLSVPFKEWRQALDDKCNEKLKLGDEGIHGF